MYLIVRAIAGFDSTVSASRGWGGTAGSTYGVEVGGYLVSSIRHVWRLPYTTSKQN